MPPAHRDPIRRAREAAHRLEEASRPSHPPEPTEEHELDEEVRRAREQARVLGERRSSD